ncbi:hypothetical protein IMY05_C4514000100 [Salix suchowensis]|nr:hypothetical protein IMY05_C4514000100 [Salix suchowensis]
MTPIHPNSSTRSTYVSSGASTTPGFAFGPGTSSDGFGFSFGRSVPASRSGSPPITLPPLKLAASATSSPTLRSLKSLMGTDEKVASTSSETNGDAERASNNSSPQRGMVGKMELSGDEEIAERDQERKNIGISALGTGGDEVAKGSPKRTTRRRKISTRSPHTKPLATWTKWKLRPRKPSNERRSNSPDSVTSKLPRICRFPATSLLPSTFTLVPNNPPLSLLTPFLFLGSWLPADVCEDEMSKVSPKDRSRRNIVTPLGQRQLPSAPTSTRTVPMSTDKSLDHPIVHGSRMCLGGNILDSSPIQSCDEKGYSTGILGALRSIPQQSDPSTPCLVGMSGRYVPRLTL